MIMAHLVGTEAMEERGSPDVFAGTPNVYNRSRMATWQIVCSVPRIAAAVARHIHTHDDVRAFLEAAAPTVSPLLDVFFDALPFPVQLRGREDVRFFSRHSYPLTRAVFAYSGVTDDDVRLFARTLTHVAFRWTTPAWMTGKQHISDGALQSLSRASRLRVLDLGCVTDVTDAGIHAVSASLETLAAGGCTRITVDGVLALGRLTTLYCDRNVALGEALLTGVFDGAAPALTRTSAYEHRMTEAEFDVYARASGLGTYRQRIYANESLPVMPPIL